MGKLRKLYGFRYARSRSKLKKFLSPDNMMKWQWDELYLNALKGEDIGTIRSVRFIDNSKTIT